MEKQNGKKQNGNGSLLEYRRLINKSMDTILFRHAPIGDDGPAQKEAAKKNLVGVMLNGNDAAKVEAFGGIFTMFNSTSPYIAELGVSAISESIMKGNRKVRQMALDKLSDLLMMDYSARFNSDGALTQTDIKKLLDGSENPKDKEQSVIRDLEETRARAGILFVQLLEKGNSNLNAQIYRIIRTAMNNDRSEVKNAAYDIIGAAAISENAAVRKATKKLYGNAINNNQNSAMLRTDG
ncbi:MAG: hypothetical protein ACHQX1_02945 [Candidatus Micrarchaeales archaeon]